MKDQILEYAIETTLYHDAPECVSIGMIMKHFDITRYRAQKIMKEMLQEGLVVQKISPGGFCEYSCRPYPPLKGYAPSFATKESEVFERINAKVHKMYEDWANSCMEGENV